MILLFTLFCPNGHPLGGKPYEFVGNDPPPVQWMDNISTQLSRAFHATAPEWGCKKCNLPLDVGFQIGVQIMKVTTLQEANAAVQGISNVI